ncbi:MAG: ribonuclease PH [Polyangiales bacterium]
MRPDQRSFDALRPVTIELGVQRFPEGSLRYRCGETSLLIAASMQDGVRDFLRGSGQGWLAAEYAMHPRATPERKARDGRRGPIDGRSQEIQRLISRSLRAAVHLPKLGEHTLQLDCDVLDADGGTRTAAITGGFVALALACDRLHRQGKLPAGVLRTQVAAVSVGLVDGKALLDLSYPEDARADFDLNVVANAAGALIEVQGTAEGALLPKAQFHALVDLALGGIQNLIGKQRRVLQDAGIDLDRLLA